jgi:hypothetical protein
MKKYFLGLLSLCLLLISFKIVIAQENNLPEIIPGKQNQMRMISNEFKEKIKNQKQENKDNFSLEREALRLKLQKLKDDKKKDSILKIHDNFIKINEVMTDKLTNFINRIEKVLENVKDKTDLTEKDGLNVEIIKQAIEEATGAINQAKQAILDQTKNKYLIEVPTNQEPQELRLKIKEIRDNFHSDLKKVHEKVKIAHEKVRISVNLLASLKSQNQNEN